MCKQSGQITVHLSPELEQAVKNLAFAQDNKPSVWVKKLIEREVQAIYLQAKNTMQAVAHLQHDGLLENCENSQIKEKK